MTVEEEAQMHQWMTRAYDNAAASQSSGGVFNAALIVDPQTGATSLTVMHQHDIVTEIPSQVSVMTCPIQG